MIGIGLACLALVTLVYALWREPSRAIHLFLLWSIVEEPLRRWQLGPQYFLYGVKYGLLGLIAFVVLLSGRRYPRGAPAYFWTALMLWLIWPLFGLPMASQYANDRSIALAAFRYYPFVLLMPVTAILWENPAREYKTLLQWFAIVTVLTTAFALVQSYMGRTHWVNSAGPTFEFQKNLPGFYAEEAGRATSIYLGIACYNQMIALTLLLGLSAMFTFNVGIRRLGFLLIVSGIIGLAVNGTRQALVVLIAAGAVLPVLARGKIRKAATAGIQMMLAISVGLLLVWEYRRSSLEALGARVTELPTSWETRQGYAQTTLAEFLSSSRDLELILGRGIGSATQRPEFGHMYAGLETVAETGWIKVIIQYGVLGLCAYGFLLFAMFRYGISLATGASRVIFPFAMLALFMSLSVALRMISHADDFSVPRFAIWLWLFWGAAQRCCQETRTGIVALRMRRGPPCKAPWRRNGHILHKTFIAAMSVCRLLFVEQVVFRMSPEDCRKGDVDRRFVPPEAVRQVEDN